MHGGPGTLPFFVFTSHLDLCLHNTAIDNGAFERGLKCADQSLRFVRRAIELQ
jgi:hypothetical protein